MKMDENSRHKVAGISLPSDIYISKVDLENGPVFVHEKGSSPYHNLQQVALSVSCHRPVLLCGPVGSGKTSTVEYLSFRTGHKTPNHKIENSECFPLFLKVQLGEQTDSRMLLGGYQCTEIPGQFVWKPGILTQAVMKGHWLLLEDIDSTSSDVVTVIENLVKTQSLCIPGYCDYIVPHKHFQLFATQRIQGHGLCSNVKFNMFKQWNTIFLKPLTSSEVVNIICKKYPKLSAIASRLVSAVEVDCFENVADKGRVPSVRDILKWCGRCDGYFETGNLESTLRIFHDAIDIFCGFMNKESRFKIASQIGIRLGIVDNKANFISNKYKPNIIISENELFAGRACIKKDGKNVTLFNRFKNNVFSLNRQSCCLIEKICCCLENTEPVLLVGETGCGKTTVLQYIADTLGKNLVVINMNQQSDTADLIGGYKPVTFKWIMKPFCDNFETLFRDLFKAEKNVECLNKFSKLVKKENWETLMNFIIHVWKTALIEIESRLKNFRNENGDEKTHLKCSEIDIKKWESRYKKWKDLGKSIEKISKQKKAAEKSLVFSFVEGSLVTAIKKGDWVLLDEINLASSETLDCLSGLLENSNESISLLEKGESHPIKRNSEFRLFAAMNPATDVGKKQLPIGLRNRFTEFYIDELDDPSDLYPLVETYLGELNQTPNKLKKIVMFYLNVKNKLKNDILNGNGKKPHFSLRNLCRALSMTSRNPCGSFPRSIYESLSVSFLTQLDSKSYQIVKDLITKAVTDGDIKTILNKSIPRPNDDKCLCLEGFWLHRGPLEPFTPEDYILTPTVQRHLRDLIKIVSLGNGIPILLEGDTSVGKTSLISYLAKCTGNICSRVNNHEHTDIQEYIGTYVADSGGKLVFKEGILCEAMRKGHWLILDELNLAPTEVLEALNRVLDDNRELFIPETQETIRAHNRFLLFATQNPTGIYGGRKELSRAFRNRFIELHFNQIPPNELVTILEKRCQLPISYCKKMVSVMTDLQLRRRGSDIFVGKSGFITLRDLFRWGERYRRANVTHTHYDWEQHMADEGYLLLAGRVRLRDETKVIEEVIAKYFKRKPDPENLFSLHENTSHASREILTKIIEYSGMDADFAHIVWTYGMRRLAVLVCKALQFSEPVLIVGETGCGKTSVVQILAKIKMQQLYSVNCHMHSEGADFLGGLRPVRTGNRAEGKLFEWCDGPLIKAMVTGSFFLADEISLADDSVLERLNSLLEPERTILLAEKGGELLGNDNDDYVIVADEKFQFIGTMNPGGDYGKKELSPALRNRFTEIWADSSHHKFESFYEIIRHNLDLPSNLCDQVSHAMVDFLKWLQEKEIGKKITLSNRDVMTWVNFVKSTDLNWFESSIQGIFLTFLDGLGSGSRIICDVDSLKNFKEECLVYFTEKCSRIACKSKEELLAIAHEKREFVVEENRMGFPPFYISKGKYDVSRCNYIYVAPTPFSNAKKIFRALTMKKAILLEGSPGVGKTSIVTALAKVTGHKLTRINLSDQTDISDLFGADLPEEGGKAGSFIWRDGPFLTALKEGHWILLDELNLASQSVLEGLNAVLDHRGSVYIPELDKVFELSQETRVFGCQNPLKEGGNRRGLPTSFLNRFTQVYVEPLTESDYTIILEECFPELRHVLIKNLSFINVMVNFCRELRQEVAKGLVGACGGPWEFNLRDMIRWAEGTKKDLNLDKKESSDFSNLLTQNEKDTIRVIYRYMDLLYLSRMRTDKDRNWVNELFLRLFGNWDFKNERVQMYKTHEHLIIGDNLASVNNVFIHGDVEDFEMLINPKNFYGNKYEPEDEIIFKLCSTYQGKMKFHMLRILEKQLPVLSNLCQCINMNWLPILVGESGSGKTSCVRVLATLTGAKLRVMSCNSAMDTTEILGGFEQADFNRHVEDIAESVRAIVLSVAKYYRKRGFKERCLRLLQKWMNYCSNTRHEDDLSTSSARERYQSKINTLLDLLENEELDGGGDMRRFAEMRSQLISELKDLEKNLGSDDWVNFGGKFEWVDSVLVKALKEGSWLLLEDVNLCSNAVLDRLNGLLEPDGCLTLGERGAGKDGQILTLTPHPDFRLIFSMDPANGFISRAMRNRGVEIFTSLNNEISNWPKLDLISLLSDAGIKDVRVQKALMKIEDDVGNLVSNGFWTSQYLKHGFSKLEAVKMSTLQKIENVSDLSKERFLDAIADLEKFGSDERQAFDFTFVRPEIDVYIVDPKYARLKQWCGLLHMILTAAATENFSSTMSPNVFFNDFSRDLQRWPPDKKLPVLGLVKLNLFHVYATAPGHVLVDLKAFMNPIISSFSHLNATKVILEVMNSLEKIAPQPRSDSVDLPWDLRWFENLYRIFGTKFNKNANNRLILMKFAIDDFNQSNIENSKKNLTVEEYSKYVEKGHAEDSFPGYPIVGSFFSFLKAFDKFTVDTLNDPELNVTDEEAKWFLGVIKWRFRLQRQGQLVLLSGPNKNVVEEDTLTLLILHLSWLYKAFINDKERGMNPQTNDPINFLRKKYKKFLEDMKKSVFPEEYSDSLIGISNEFRKCLRRSPLERENMMTCEPDEPEADAKEVTERNETIIKPDPVIIRSVLNDYVEYFNGKIARFLDTDEEWRSNVGSNVKFLSILGLLENQVRHVGKLKSSFETFLRSKSNGKPDIVSELLYFSLRILNENYSFSEEAGETEILQVSSILPYHRPVWTCRILEKVFDPENLWALSNYDKFQNDFENLALTVFPNVVRRFEKRNSKHSQVFDFWLNEKQRLKYEVEWVMSAAKKTLNASSLEDEIKKKLERSRSLAERNFFSRLSETTALLLSLLDLERDERTELNSGCLWLILGLLEFFFLREGKIDPIRKKLIKSVYAQNEVEGGEVELMALKLHSSVTGISLDHFYVKKIKDQLRESREKLEKYQYLKRIERDPTGFRIILAQIDGFQTVSEEIVSFCQSVAQRRFPENSTHNYCRKGRYFLLKIRSLCQELEKFVLNFRDLIYPILAALSEIEHGLNLILSELIRLPFNCSKEEEFESYVTALAAFPVPIGADVYTNFNTLSRKAWPSEALKRLQENKVFLLFGSYLASYNEWWYFRKDEQLLQLLKMFSAVVEYWKIEEERLKQKEIEKESLYLKRGAEQCKVLTEEEELLNETLNLFPTFENDFSDGNSKNVVKNVCGSLNENHFLQISHFHKNIMTDSAIVEWNSNSRLSSAPKSPDHVTPICMRFTLLFEILPHVSFLLTRKTDEKLLPGLLVLMQARKSGFFNSDVKILGKSDRDHGYDFYRDENLPEVKKCLEILEDLKKSINYFLKEWPEHPGLLEMKRIIEKILSFPIASPIMRFLTGLELLLKCGQDWERVAIEEVSILDHIQKLTGLIIEWRKLELKGWKTCLEAAHRRLKEKAVKWWFHLWCLVEEYLGKDKPEEEIFFDDLLKTLSNFLETSPVCEFDVRLEIILSYHHHLLHMPASRKRDNLCIALWNLHAFYQQFKSEVFKKLKTDSSPIFTKLNQFVKIAKWHDITYWSVKEAINKSHKTLIKFVKEYEVLLKQKVDLTSIDLTSNGKKDESKHLIESSKPFIDKTSRQKQLNVIDEKLFTLIKLREKFKRARKYSEEIIKRDRYSNLIFDLDDLAIKICENVDHYGKLDVNRELSIEKQRSQAKNIVHQKKRALTDLFKMLSLIGVSYRAGSIEAPFGVVEMCKSPPMSHLDDGSFSSDGENYYLKNISRRFRLLNSLLTPSKEIGPQIIERLKGFSGHLMEMNRKLRISLSDSSTQINRLGNFGKMLNSLVGAEGEQFFIVSQKRFGDRVVLLLEFLQKTCYRLDEFECLLDSWPEPERHDMKRFSYLGGDETPEIFTASKSDHLYRETLERFNEISKKFSFLKSEVERNFLPKTIYRNRIRNGKNKIFKDGFVFFTSKDVTFFNEYIDECRIALGTLEDFTNIFNNDCVECDLTRGLSEILESFGNLPLKYSAMDTITGEERINFKKNVIDLVEKLIKSILLGVERVVKAAPTEPNFSQGSSVVEPFHEVNGALMNRHLTEKLIDSIENDLSHLNLAAINKIQLKLFHQLSGCETSDIIYAATDIYGILNVANSFVQIFFTLCEYFVSRQSLCYRTSGKLTSIIHKVFIMVAQKGYCAPPEYEEEEEEDGEGKGGTKKDKEGGGFTGNDGLGEEDVSGRIESEDQLEDARAGGSEKEEEGREECEENENGIEMSENFDGKTQSIDKKENDDETDEGETESENELDVEMGETENDADKLDSRMWSDSSDEEDINKNAKGGGEEIDEDEYAAKGEEEENNSDGENSSRDRKKRQKKKDLNDMEDADDNGDQVDPYHGHNEPEPEPEPLNLPDDMQLDDGEAKDDENGEKENPFDIDSMKKHQFPMETDENGAEEEEQLDREEDEQFDGGSQSGESEPMQIDEMESNQGEGETQEEEDEQKEKEPDKYNEEVECGAIEEKEREKKEEENLMNSEVASVSNEKPSEMPAQAAPETKASCDQVGESTENETKDLDAQETFHDSEVEAKGVGQAEAQGNRRGHEAKTSKKEKFKSGEPQARKERKRERPGKSADDRCLGDEQSTFNKRLKTIDEPEKKRYDESEDKTDLDQSDTYQHVSEKIDNAMQLLDAATKEQSRDQSMPVADDEDALEDPENDNIDQDIQMDVDEESEPELQQTSVMKPSEFEKIKNENKNSENETGEGKAEDVKQEIGGEVIETMMVERGPETSFFSKLSEFNAGEMCLLEPDQIESLREEIQRQLLLQNNQGFVTGESTQTWQLLVSVVDGLARDLSEQLRPILEPSRATRLKGDYRTGRRINMRKVISYVASEFRKDNIWLRRTKPWKRDHEIVVALDDSHSMFHNESRELAFESLALVFRALELIEAGRLGVLSFGEKTKIVHSLNETFSIYAGARIIQEFSFEQKKTLLCEMLNLSVSMMTKEKRGDNVAQLLLIISDGRGVFSEGLEEVKKAVRRAIDSGIFIVFIIIDNPKSKDSIMDIRMPEFRDGKFVEMKSYMEHFPFPFYLVVRNIATLPNTLSDALRQWFQLIHCNNSDS